MQQQLSGLLNPPTALLCKTRGRETRFRQSSVCIAARMLRSRGLGRGRISTMWVWKNMGEDLDYVPRPGSSWSGLTTILRKLEQTDSSDRIASKDVAAANRDMRHLGCQ